MTLNQLLYFDTLARLNHMGQAAEQLFISQPSLSVAMTKLEEELGVCLFGRRGRRISLTSQGEAFWNHVRVILREVEEARFHMSRLAERQQKKICMGCTTPLLRNYFPQKMREFLRIPGNEQISFEFSVGNTGELIRRLKNGLYDLLLCSGSADQDLEQIPIFSEPIGLITPEGEGDPPLSWEALARLPLIGYEEDSVLDRRLRKMAEEQGVTLSFVYRAPTEDAIASLVEHGFGCAVIPWSESLKAGYRIAQFPLPGGPYTRELFLTTLRSQVPQGAAARFVEFLLAV